MKTLRKLRAWLTVSRVLITIGNILFFCYHFFWIGINGYSSIIMQIIALLTEYLVSGWYEKILLQSNRKINEYTRHYMKKQKWMLHIPIKWIVFTTCFLVVYISIYYLRLQFFYSVIHWGITAEQVEKGLRNALIAAPVLGPIMGSIVIWRKKKLYQKRQKSPSV